jgi:DNA-binding response OmpR family regulator
MRILVVEDDPVALLLLQSELRCLGHDVVVARDGEEGWLALRDKMLKVVISDWRLPRLDGLDLCRRIRGQREDYVSFLLLTEQSASEENVGAAIQAGVDEFLCKPVRALDLRMRLNAVARILGFTAEVRKLKSFLPICCYCKKIRDDRDYWQEIEKYLTEQSGTALSHGVCPSCYSAVLIPQMHKLGIVPPPYTQSRSRPT